MSDSHLDLRDRARLFRRLTETEFDVVVIGAGITGAGIARDAALRGLSVALLEARDFASGTSSRSSKLVHGGIRYLAQADVALVREAALERKAVRNIAPHRARTTLFLVPVRSRLSLAMYRAGLWTYENLGSVPGEERHQMWTLEDLQREEPLLRTDGLIGAMAYPEYITDDARLTLANVRGAAQAGAVVANYAPVVGVDMDGSRASAVRISDALEEGDDSVALRGKVIVNAAGPWADGIRHFEQEDVRDRLQLTKGIHLVVSRERLPVRHTSNMTAPDGRIVFAIPRDRHVYLGTTDTFVPEPGYWPELTAEDIDYVLGTANASLDTKPLEREDVVSYWSGIRPLLAEPGKSPSEISRRDELMVGEGGIVTIAGGKLTAFRQMAERVVDRCLDIMDTRAQPCATRETALPGGDFPGNPTNLIAELERAGNDTETATRLVMLYGIEAQVVAAAGGDVAAEVEQAVLREGAQTLEDWWVRRSARAWFSDDGGMDVLEDAANAMARHLGWDDAKREAQLSNCRAQRAADLQALGRA